MDIEKEIKGSDVKWSQDASGCRIAIGTDGFHADKPETVVAMVLENMRRRAVYFRTSGQERLDGMTRDNTRLLGKVRTAEAERDKARSVANQLARDLEDAAGELAVPLPEPGTTMAKVISANLIMRRERDAARSEVERLRAQLDELTKDHEAVTANARGYQETIAECHVLLDRLGSGGTGLRNRVEDFVRRHEAAVAERDEATGRLEAALTDISKLEDSRAMLTAANAALGKERDAARAEADALREELATLREEADDDARGAATVEDLYTTCINLLRDAGDRFGFLRGTATGMLRDLIAKHEAALSDVSKLEAERDEARAEADKLLGIRHDLEETEERFSREREVLMAERDDAQRRLAGVKTDELVTALASVGRVRVEADARCDRLIGIVERLTAGGATKVDAADVGRWVREAVIAAEGLGGVNFEADFGAAREATEADDSVRTEESA